MTKVLYKYGSEKINDKLLETTIFASLPLILLEVLYSRCCKQG